MRSRLLPAANAASYHIVLRNESADTVTLELETSDGDDACQFSLPDRVSVAARSETTVELTVKPRRRRWRGAPIVHEFSVAASGGGGPGPVTVLGQFEERPQAWLPPAAGAGVLGVAVAAFVALGLLGGGGGPEAVGAPATSPSPTPAATAAATPAATATAAVAASPTPVAAVAIPEQTLRRPATPFDPARSLDPQMVLPAGPGISLLSELYSGLLNFSSDLVLVPDLAEEIPTIENGGISDDGLTYTFRLREELKWSDGNALVAQDFVNGARRLFDTSAGALGLYTYGWFQVLAAGGFNLAAEETFHDMDLMQRGTFFEETIRQVSSNLEVFAPDDRTVVYRLNRPSLLFPTLAAIWPLYPIRQDLIDEFGDEWTAVENHVGNGPYMLAEWVPGERLVVVSNPHYHGEPRALERIERIMFFDAEEQLQAYRRDELDMVDLSPAQVDAIRGTSVEDDLRFISQLTTDVVWFNVQEGPLADVRVRQALAGALDRNAYSDVAYGGSAVAAYSWVPPGLPGHDPTLGLQYRDGLDQARRLLADAGFPGGAGLEISLIHSSPLNEAARTDLEWVVAQWESNLGLSVTLEPVDSASFGSNVILGQFEVMLSRRWAEYPDVENFLSVFRSNSIHNIGRFNDAEFDGLLDAAKAQQDSARRLELYRQAQVRLSTQVPVIPLVYPRPARLTKPWVKGVIFTDWGPFMGNAFIFGRE